MGLLDNIFASSAEDPRYAANMGLFTGMMRGDLAGGLEKGAAAGAQARTAQQEAAYKQLMAQNLQSEMAARQLKAQQEQAAMEQAARVRQGLPGLYTQPGFTGGAPAPQAEGGVPMFSRPMGTTPMQTGPGGFDAQAALRLGVPIDDIPKLAAIADLGKRKATRQMEVDDGKGGKRIALVDDYGQEVAGFSGYTAPVQVNQGDRVSFVKPAPGVNLPVNMSPEAKASNALGWANHGLTKRGQDMTDARARETNASGKAPAGYRLAADGRSLEFIPGGPADPNAAKKAAPTEFQGKAAMFGNRAAEADKIISGLDGKYSPSAINTKKALGNVWGIGGALESVGNAALPANAQKAEQAERDFVNAVLRLESGAAIGKDEFDNARKQYFPQPFDSAAVKKQKAENRARAIQGLMDNARTSSGSAQPQQGGATGGWSIQRVN